MGGLQGREGVGKSQDEELGDRRAVPALHQPDGDPGQPLQLLDLLLCLQQEKKNRTLSDKATRL